MNDGLLKVHQPFEYTWQALHSDILPSMRVCARCDGDARTKDWHSPAGLIKVTAGLS